jgi:hypothetical protein
MHKGSSSYDSSTNLLSSWYCARKSLFRNILAISPYGSRFCPDSPRSTLDKLLRMKILQKAPKNKDRTTKDTKVHEGPTHKAFLCEPSCPSWLRVLERTRRSYDIFTRQRERNLYWAAQRSTI